MTDSSAGPAWKHGAVPVIGLTGAIGGGKSLVASLLAEQGARVIDADALGHQVLEDPPTRQRVIDQFGARILQPAAHGEPAGIDRKRLAGIVFNDAEALGLLETIVHPEMRRLAETTIETEVREGSSSLIVIDAAILFEAGWDSLCDLVVFVEASRAVRLARVSESRGWTPEILASREKAQWASGRKKARANVVIRNESTVERLRGDVLEFLGRLNSSNDLESFEGIDNNRVFDDRAPVGPARGDARS
jgi:dephospho-CoA kinase